MIKNIARKLRLTVPLAILAIPFGSAIAQSTTTTPPAPPTVVTGTNPEPQVIASIILSVLFS
jgi:hypothetical protein